MGDQGQVRKPRDQDPRDGSAGSMSRSTTPARAIHLRLPLADLDVSDFDEAIRVSLRGTLIPP